VTSAVAPLVARPGGVLFVGDVPALAGVEFVGRASTDDQVLHMTRRLAPRIAVVEVGMAIRDDGRLLRLLRAHDVSALALASDRDAGAAVAAVLHGARGIVDAEALPESVVDAIDRVARGELVLEGRAGAAVLDSVRAQLADQADEARRAAELTSLVDTVVAGDGLAVVFQPIFDVATRTVIGYEALSRFSLEPPRSPDRVFAAAGTIGRGPELEVTAIRLALRALDRIPRDCYLALNASPATVLSEPLRRLLDELGAVDRIVLEITENAAVDDYDALAATLRPLRDRGLRLAIDDTGAGFASLRHILRLEPDIIKLDRSITERIDADRSTRALAAALTLVALESGMSTVAEGIETSSQLAILEAIGVTSGQGFLLGRPGPIAGR
jgi:EAL domain-containing protein (putative c-di-GMP-specific phosphodiesterase class I)